MVWKAGHEPIRVRLVLASPSSGLVPAHSLRAPVHVLVLRTTETRAVFTEWSGPPRSSWLHRSEIRGRRRLAWP